MDKVSAYGVFGLAIALFVIIPTLFLSLNLDHDFVHKVLASFDQALILGIFLAIFLVVSQASQSTWLMIVLSSLASLYYLIVSFIIGYWIYRGNEFDIFFIIDGFRNISSTAVNIFGWTLVLYVSLFLALGICYFVLFMKMFKCFKHVRIKHLGTCLFLITTLVVTEFSLMTSESSPTGYISYTLQKSKETTEARHSIFPSFPDNSHYSTQSNENFFILQLESGNALAINGNLTINGIVYNETYNPEIREIAKDGAYIPYFWGNSMQTNRAHENILCGITNNIGKAYSLRLNELNVSCLPEILNRMKFTTLVFRSDNLDFMNTGGFMKHIGFKEIHYDDIMQDGDLEFKWGYDDCLFYKRAFEYLKEHFPVPERLFVYFEVSTNHYGFDPKEEYRSILKFLKSGKYKNFIEKYLDSYSVQDYCAGKFYEEFMNYSSYNSHLMILDDHSYPIGLHSMSNEIGATNENFLVTFTYVPPKNRKNEFKIGTEINEMFGETDVLPTIFDLLNNQKYQNSFAFALRGKPKNMYEDCHILIQPYDGVQISVVKNLDKYLYSATNETLVYYNLSNDWYEQNPVLLSENLSYADFRGNYFCKRFRTQSVLNNSLIRRIFEVLNLWKF